MKKIIFIFLFFCLAITTVLAQVATINIATPNSNGLSNNQVSDFDVNSDGTILNNSATGGTAQLGNTAVTGNSNITTGSEADLILFQVTGSGGSNLEGTIEVFGGEAGVIIANPNGIVCDGCGFINANKVDLVTGTANFSGDDLTGFSIDGSSTLTVSGSGFLSDAVADELKLESQNIIINAQVRANNSLEIIVNDYTQSGTIDVIGDLSIQVTSEASLDDNASIKARNLFFSADGLYNQADITITDNATFDLENNFFNGFNLDGTDYNGGDIIANDFNVTAGNDFLNRYNATITANNSFNVVVGGGTFRNRDTATITADSFNVTTGTYFYNYMSTITANSFNVTTGTYFSNQYSATITANDFNVTAGSYFENTNSTISANDFNVTAEGDFVNKNSATIDADTVTIEVTNFADDIFNTGTVSADSLNLIFTDDFVHNSTSFNGFSFNNLAITADNYTQGASIDIAGDISIQASGKASLDDNASIKANNLFFSAYTIYNQADITIADSATFDIRNKFLNGFYQGVDQRKGGNIRADNFNVTAVGNFSNQYYATINANDFNVVAGGDFTNLFSNISANNFNVVAGGDFSNSDTDYGSIRLSTISANNFNVVAGGSFYNHILAIIKANDFSVTVDNFFNTHNLGDGDITADTFNLSVAGDFDYASDYLNNGNIDATHQSFIARNGDFTNNTSIDLVGNLGITADNFINTNGNITADTFNLSVAGDFDYVDDYLNNGTITTNSFNLQVGGNFSNNDSANDFTWGANDSLVVEGISFITVNSFFNNGDITADTFNLSVAGDFDYSSDYLNNGNIDATHQSFTARDGDFTNNTSIDLVGNLGITADNFINTNGNITADTFNLYVVGDFDYVDDFGTITTTVLNFNVGGDFSNNDSANDFTWGANDSLVVEGISFITVNSFLNNGEITADTFNLSVAGDFDYASDYLNNGNIDATHQSFIARNGDFTNNTSIDLVGNLGITADNFINTNGNITADTFNLYVVGDFDYVDDFGTITTTALNLNVAGNFSYDNVNNFIWAASDSLTVAGNANIDARTGDYTQNGGIVDVAGALTVSASDFDLQNGSTINVGGTLSVSATTSFTPRSGATISVDTFDFSTPILQNQATFTANDGTINIGGGGSLQFYNNSDGEFNINNSLDIITAGEFSNYGDISAGDTLTITLTDTAESFFNGSGTNGNISANIFNLSVAGDFDYEDDYLNNGTITTNSFNLQVGGNFSYDDSTNNFTWNANDSLVVSGNADITTDNYTQNGAIDITGALTITANNFTYTRPNNDFVLAENDSLNILGDFTIATNNFNNSGSITTDSFEITAGYTAINQGSIVSGSLDVTTDDFFRNLTGGDISVDSLNITAGGKVTNTANITVGTLNIIANNNSSRTNDPAGAFFYVSNRGNITATDLNIAAVDNFYNRGNITADNFQITRAKSVFFLNEEIDSFVGTYDGGNISLSGDSSFTADGGDAVDGGIIVNRGNIDLGGFNLIIAADSFINHAGANVTADTLNLTVSSFINDGTIDASIDQ